eukprot:2967428-Karenia_brevis.AAC.1
MDIKTRPTHPLTAHMYVHVLMTLAFVYVCKQIRITYVDPSIHSDDDDNDDDDDDDNDDDADGEDDDDSLVNMMIMMRMMMVMTVMMMKALAMTRMITIHNDDGSANGP